MWICGHVCGGAGEEDEDHDGAWEDIDNETTMLLLMALLPLTLMVGMMMLVSEGVKMFMFVFMVRNVGCRRLSECAGHGSGGYYVDVHDTGSCDRPVCDEGTCAVYSLARKWGTCKLPW